MDSVDVVVRVRYSVEPRREVPPRDELGGNARTAGDVERAARPVGDDDDDREPAVEHRAENGPAAGREHSDTHSVTLALAFERFLEVKSPEIARRSVSLLSTP